MEDNMHLVDHGLKIVVLKRPYDTYRDSKEMRDLLSLVFKLKLDGYSKYYPYGILPISDVDFIADHILMCRYNGDMLVPVSGFKSIKYSECLKFKIPFPIAQHKFGQETGKFSNYISGINNWMESLSSLNIDFAYNLSWTIQPEIEKAVRNTIRELTFALMYFHYNNEGIKNVINSTAALRGINAQEERMEMQYLRGGDGTKLGAFESPTFFGQPFYIMHTKQSGFGELFIKDCEKFQHLWDSRSIIGELVAEKKVA